MLMLRLGNSFDCSMQPDVSATRSRGGTSVLSFKMSSLLYPYVFSESNYGGTNSYSLGMVHLAPIIIYFLLPFPPSLNCFNLSVILYEVVIDSIGTLVPLHPGAPSGTFPHT